MTIHGEAHLSGISVFLAVVLPPADWAEAHRIGNFQSLISTARAAETGCDGTLHGLIDGGI
jgi:hypothetical protein